MTKDLVVPKPLPREFIRGYLGRTTRLNGYPNLQALFSRLRANRKTPIGGREPSTFTLIAEMCCMPLHDLAIAHTFLPLNRAVVCNQPESADKELDSENLVRWHALRMTFNGWRSCRSCVREDIATYGYAYWRRDFQLPGIIFCNKHVEGLVVTADRNAPFEAPPGKKADGPYVMPPRNSRTYAALERFSEISFALTDRRTPLPWERVSQALSRRACELLLHASPCDEHLKLSARAIATMPQQWLEEIFTLSPQWKRHRRPIRILDTVLKSRLPVSTPTIVLAAALLYERADQALREISPTEQEEENSIKRASTHQEESFWAADRIRGVYVQCGGSFAAVAQELGCTVRTAGRRLKSMGLPNLRSGIDLHGYVRGVLEFMTGGDIDEICQRLNLRVFVLHELLRASVQPTHRVMKTIAQNAKLGRTTTRVKGVSHANQDEGVDATSDYLSILD